MIAKGDDVLHGQFNNASEEFRKAFSVNPSYIFITDYINKITQKKKVEKEDNAFVIGNE